MRLIALKGGTLKHWGVLMEDQVQYYSRRAAEELQAAARASSPAAQLSHRQLAERYASIVQEEANRPTTAAGGAFV
jgi:hypothetical protein